MDSLEMSGIGIRAREEALERALESITPKNRHPALDNPVRRHDSDGIGEAQTQQNTLHAQFKEAADLALEFVNDCCDPEAYGHALPVELVARAGRICALLRPKVCERPRVGYMEPPPARCAHCDDQ